MSKVFVIGIDGGTFKVIDYLIGQNRLPNFAAILGKGSRATLMSSIPPVTPAAWASFYTSSNPGVHGAADFYASGTYKLVPINGGSIDGVSLWVSASERGKRVCVYNVPLTYPARPVNGVLVSGMDAPRVDEKAVYPREFKDALFSRFPDFSKVLRLDVKDLANHSQDPVGEFINIYRNYLDLEIQVVRHLMQIEDWDLMVAVFQVSDVFQHTFWREAEKAMEEGKDSMTPQEARKAEAVFACYETLDRELGETWAKWGNDRNLVFMSDHGFGLLRRDVCINKILAEAGLLTFRQKGFRQRSREYIYNKVTTHIPADTRRRLFSRFRRGSGREDRSLLADSLIANVDWTRTKIFAKGAFGCLFVNLAGREPMGIVSPGPEQQDVIKAAERALTGFVDSEDGQPLVSEFIAGRKIFHGPRAAGMPDAVAVLRNYAYRTVPNILLEQMGRSIVRQPNPDWKELAHTGHHRREGMLAMYGPDIRHADLEVAEIVDVAPTVLHLLDLPKNTEYEGKVLEDAVKRTRAASGENASQAGWKEDSSGNEGYSDEDEEEIRKRLQNLGYL